MDISSEYIYRWSSKATVSVFLCGNKVDYGYKPLYFTHYAISNVLASFFLKFLSLDDDDRDMQGERAVDYGKRHPGNDILWIGSHAAVTY